MRAGHAGAIERDSRPGEGTNFTVRIPLHGAVEEMQQAA
jgi:signal transduction histidine kinase